jgi:hypothetical protein
LSGAVTYRLAREEALSAMRVIQGSALRHLAVTSAGLAAEPIADEPSSETQQVPPAALLDARSQEAVVAANFFSASFSSSRVVPTVFKVGKTTCSRNTRELIPAPLVRSLSW